MDTINDFKNDQISRLLEEAYSDVLKELLNILNEKQSVCVCLTGNDTFLCETLMRMALEEYEAKTFRDIAKSNDYLEADRHGQIKVSNIRDIIAFSALRSEFLKHKYIIISDIHRANNISENSLLKLFEEPPNDTVIITWTNSYYSLLSTIRSRLFKLEVKKRIIKSDESENEEWRWLSGDDLRFFTYSLSFPPEEKSYISQTVRKNSFEDNLKDYCLLCGGSLPGWMETFTLNPYAWRELMGFFLAESLIVSCYEGENLLISDFTSEIQKNIKGMNVSDFFSTFFRVMLGKLTRMIYDTVILEFGNDWENIGYTYMNAKYFKLKKTLDIDGLNNFIRWCEKISGMEKMTVNPDLSLKVFDIMLRRVFK